MADTHFAVTLRRSGAGRCLSQRQTLVGLGLTKVGKTVHLQDTPSVRGMIYKVVHLVDLERCNGPAPIRRRRRSKAAG